jgi:hypothetical protein
MTELLPTHVWIKRTLFLKGKDASISNTVVEFGDPLSEASMAKAFIEILQEFGNELELADFSPVRMDTGRYIIQSHAGFSVVELDPAWTQQQVEEMENAAAPALDWKVWGDVFTKEEA